MRPSLARLLYSFASLTRACFAGLDAAMLAPTSKYQKWRTANKRTECRNAFQCALPSFSSPNKKI